MLNGFKKIFSLPFSVTFFGVFAVAFLAAWAIFFFSAPKVMSLETLSTCMKPGPFGTLPQPECLKSVVNSLLTEYSTKDLMTYIIASSTSAVITQNCHAIGHIVGEKTFEHSTGLETALAQCNNNCRSACVHGALGAGFMAETGSDEDDIAHAKGPELVTEGTKYCAQSIPLCHGMGHIFFMNFNDYTKALEGCQDISTGFAQEACYQGVFMEAAGGADSLSLEKRDVISEVDYTYPCSSIASRYQHACFQLLGEFQHKLFEQQKIFATSTRLEISTHTCEQFSAIPRSQCFEGMGVLMNLLTTRGDVPSLCEELPSLPDRKSCTIGAASTLFYMIRFPLLSKYCDGIHESERQTLCYNTVFQLMTSLSMQPSQISAACVQNGSELCTNTFKEFQKSGARLPDYRFGLFGK